MPRAILTPPRLALQLVFLPLREGLRVVSRRAAGDDDLGEDDVRTVRVLPHFAYLSGFGLTVGGAVSYENLGGHGEEAGLVARFGGVYAQAAELSFRADRAGGSRLWLESSTRWESRPQELFQGLGDHGAPASRYAESRLVGVLRAGVTSGEPGSLVNVGASAIVDHARFGSKDDGWSADPSIETVHDTRRLAGFTRGVDDVELQANLVVDTRDAPAAPSRGILTRAFVGGVPETRDAGYAHAGVDATGHVDLYRKTRVLVLRGAIEAVSGDDTRIPFVQLPRLGGPDGLRGYRLDRFRDGKSALASIEYRYPIHESVAGALFVDAGRVGPTFAELGAVGRYRVGVGAGLRVRSRENVILSVDVAYGEGPEVFLTLFPPHRGVSR